MNQAIHFKTSMFDVSKEKKNPLNPIYGRSLLEWLQTTLKGTLTISEPDAEDWGWYSELEFEGNHYMIGSCAYYEDGDDPAEALEWVFQIDKYRSFKEKLFGQNQMTKRDRCYLFFKTLFEKHPDFTDVQSGQAADLDSPE